MVTMVIMGTNMVMTHMVEHMMTHICVIICPHNVPIITIVTNISNEWLTRYTLAGAGLLFVPVHLLFTITAEEQGERFLVRLWNTIRSVVVSTNTNTNTNISTQS